MLTRFVTHPDEVARIAAHGQEVALRDFSFERMMERWIASLRQLHESALREGSGRVGRTQDASVSLDECPAGGPVGSGVRRAPE